MHSLGQSQSKINFTFSLKSSRIVDQSKPDSHYDSPVDSYISCNMFAANCNTNAKGEHSTQPLEKLTMHKCLVPAQNRLPNALGEEAAGGNNFRVRKTNSTFNYSLLFQFLIMTFLNICQISLCIVGFYPIDFISFYPHCSIIYL